MKLLPEQGIANADALVQVIHAFADGFPIASIGQNLVEGVFEPQKLSFDLIDEGVWVDFEITNRKEVKLADLL